MPVKGRCFVTRQVIEAALAEAEAKKPLETGGVFLGLYAGQDVWIQHIIGPGPAAVHEPARYVPDHEYQEQEISRLYKQSDRRFTYLGDWHSHPSGPEALSPTDIATLKSIARYVQARQPRPIMMIIAGGSPWHVAVWQLRLPRMLRCRPRLRQLHLITPETFD